MNNENIIKFASALANLIKNSRSYSEKTGCAHAADGIYWLVTTNKIIDIEFVDENNEGGFRLYVCKDVKRGTVKTWAEASPKYEKRFIALAKRFGVSLS